MDGKEQKAHTKVTNEIADAVEEMAKTAADRMDNIEASVREARAYAFGLMSDERTDRLTLAEQQRNYVDGEDNKIRRSQSDQSSEIFDRLSELDHRMDIQITIYPHIQTTFFGRLKWLLVGR